MVKNESHIILRCLHAASPFADAVLVSDTGSTDNTVELAESFSALPCKVVQENWCNFGLNRTSSLRAARKFVTEELKWDVQDTYALVVDADMRLQGSPAALRKELRAKRPSGVQLIQKSEAIEYANVRIMRLGDPWVCEGVTHEFWTGGSEESILFDQSVAWIEDIGDGGAKADKFERDERLLLAGLAEKPDSERYLFYLAQTYHCLNRHVEAIEYYEKRIAAGGWAEEIWYSHYMIVCNFLRLHKPHEAELFVQRAYDLQPERIEAMLHFITYLRNSSQHFKAWHYLLLAEKQAKPKVSLFLEADAYGHRLDYERTILHYYVKTCRGEGALLCMAYKGPHEHSCLTNLPHYVQEAPRLSATRLHFPCPSGYVSSSVALTREGLLCVRTVSYLIAPDGSYLMPSGLVETRNFLADWSSKERTWSRWREALPEASCTSRWKRDDLVRGLEDVRIWGGEFTATTREFSYCGSNRMVHGTIDEETGLAVFSPVHPPESETSCEKNWLPLGGGLVLYGWSPLQIGRVEGGGTKEAARLRIVQTQATPGWFRHLRGSSSPFEIDGQLWALAHVVAPTSPRQYFLVWVVLEKGTYKPLKHSDPFYLHHKGIEYCLGAAPAKNDTIVQLFLSVWDRESWLVELSVEDLKKRMREI